MARSRAGDWVQSPHVLKKQVPRSAFLLWQMQRAGFDTVWVCRCDHSTSRGMARWNPQPGCGCCKASWLGRFRHGPDISIKTRGGALSVFHHIPFCPHTSTPQPKLQLSYPRIAVAIWLCIRSLDELDIHHNRDALEDVANMTSLSVPFRCFCPQI